MELKDYGVLLFHAFLVWLLCTIVMVIGMATLPIDTAVLAHAFAAPFIALAFSWIYFAKFNKFNPWIVAAVFLTFVILMDLFVIALIILQNFEMFFSPLGTWIPFALIFMITFAVGMYKRNKTE